MADGTTIEWTDASWSPITGCDRVSPGCDRCYALTMAKRLKAMGSPRYQTDGDPRTSGPGFGVAMHEDALSLPLRWRKPRRVFVNSMSDLFHPKVPDDFIAKMFAVMAITPQHTYQALTKRAARMRSLLNSPAFRIAVLDRMHMLVMGEIADAAIPTQILSSYYGRRDAAQRGDRDSALPGWPLPNVHLGVSVEDQERADARIPALLDTPAAVRWISAEPLLGPVDLDDCAGVAALEPDWVGSQAGGMGAPHPLLDWAVLGGESGPGARPMDLTWAQTLVDQCRAAGTPVFVKQLGSAWGAHHHDIDLFPEGLRVREYPNPERP
jgi:protein gp37